MKISVPKSSLIRPLLVNTQVHNILIPEMNLSASDILIELPKLSPAERLAILNRLIELDEDVEILEENRRHAVEAFLMLDALEAEDAENE